MGKRKVDALAGKGSLADKLRRQREAFEAGDPSGGRIKDEPKRPDENSPEKVIERGYLISKED